MSSDSKSSSLIRVGTQTITRYSNQLVKRSLEQILARSQSVSTLSGKKRLLLGADWDEHIDIVFAELFENFEVDVVEYYNDDHLDPIMIQMSKNKYDVVVPTNLGVSPHCIPRFVSLIKQFHPTTRIVVVSGYGNLDFVLDLIRRGIDDFFFIIFEEGELLRRIKELLTT